MNSLIVPVRIMVEQKPFSDFIFSRKSGLYNANGEEFLLLDKPEPIPSSTYSSVYFANWIHDQNQKDTNNDHSQAKVTYSDYLFSEQISINTIDLAREFCAKYSQHSFLQAETMPRNEYKTELSKGWLVTENSFLEIILNRVATFHLAKDSYHALNACITSVFDEAKIREAFNMCLTYFSSQRITGFSKIFDRAIDNFEIIHEKTDIAATIAKRPNGKDSTVTLSKCRNIILEKIGFETRGVSITQSTDDFVFEYLCPTLSSAM